MIADSLSRDHHIALSILTQSFTRLLPDQAPSKWTPVQLPAEIILWIYSLKECLTAPMALPQALNKSKLGALLDGVDSSQRWESTMNSLMAGPSCPKFASCVLLQQAYDEICMAKERKNNWQEEQLVPPSRTYVRPFGRTFGVTPL